VRGGSSTNRTDSQATNARLAPLTARAKRRAAAFPSRGKAIRAAAERSGRIQVRDSIQAVVMGSNILPGRKSAAGPEGPRPYTIAPGRYGKGFARRPGGAENPMPGRRRR